MKHITDYFSKTMFCFLKRNTVFLYIGICWLSCFFSGATNAAERVVSLSPALSETIAHLGQTKKLVGRTTACTYPEEILSVPEIGDFAIPSLERIVRTKPDLIVADTLKDREQLNIFSDLGIPFQVLPLNSVEEYKNAVRTLGVQLGCEKEAAAEIARVESGMEAYRAVSYSHIVNVLFLVWDNPPIIPGGKSFLNDFLACAGGRNIAEKEDRGYFVCSLEWVLQQPVDCVIAPSDAGLKTERKLNLPEVWNHLPAIVEGNVFTSVDERVVNRLGPRLFEGIEALRRVLHPELYVEKKDADHVL